MPSDPADAAEAIAAALLTRGETLAVAETAAGGLISASLLAIPGASAWFLGGAVAYSSAAKQRWLGLDAARFSSTGVVSEEAALALATAARSTLGATWGLAEVGIAGPQAGRRSAKPAGLAFLAVTGPEAQVYRIETGLDGRAANQRAFAAEALLLLLRVLASAAGGARSPDRPPAPAAE